jgi:hypothetical protein
MKRISLFVFAALSFTAWACAESNDSAVGSFGADSGTGTDGGGVVAADGGGGGSTVDGSTPVQDGGVVSTAIVINEISGKGEEWIELVNASKVAVDISGYGLTDRDKEGGAPKPGDIVTFPAGTILSPNAYLLVSNPPSDAGADASVCPAGGQSYCVKSKFGISNKDGDTIYFLDPAEAVIGKEDYPAGVVATGQTWGRLPSATGTMQVNQPTPGALNKAP